MIAQAQLLGQLQRVQSLFQAGQTAQAWVGIAPLRAAIGDHGQALRLYALVAQGAGQIEPAADALRRIIAIEREPPEIVGALLLLSTPGSTAAVDAESAATLVYPRCEPVTWTVIRFPTWAWAAFRVGWVAPVIATPSAFHW